MTTFEQLGLSAPLLAALSREGYETPTPIQAQAIPPLLEGKDLLGVAQTGTGKTAAFALPILDRLLRARRITRPGTARVVVLAPTRELASQIAESFAAYGRNINLSILTIFGGVAINKQKRAAAAGADVVVATPGRLLDLLQQRDLTLGETEVFVLDEADQMLDLGFIHTLRKMIPMLPKSRQTLLFSATMPAAIRDLADKFLTNPVEVAVAPQSTTAERVNQKAYMVSREEKAGRLIQLIGSENIDRALIFMRTKHGADRLVRQLAAAGLEAVSIHGNKSQPQRERALASFRGGYSRLMVATDIAARGLDIDGVSHVFNYELPNVPEQYVHRIGRTARAGASGEAISLVSPDERVYLKDIEKLIRQRVWIVGPDGNEPTEAFKARPPRPGTKPRVHAAPDASVTDAVATDDLGTADIAAHAESGAEPVTAAAPTRVRPERMPYRHAEGGDAGRAGRSDGGPRGPRQGRRDGDGPFAAGRSGAPRGPRPVAADARPDDFEAPPRRDDRPYEGRGGEGRPARNYGPRPDGDRPPYRPRGERSEAGANAGGDRPRGDRPDRPPRRDDRPFEARGGEGRPARSYGPRPDGDRPPYRPRGERSEAGAGAGGDRPRGDRPARSYGPRPDGDRPPYRPRGERSEAGANAGGDRPRGDRPARSYGPRADGDRPPYRPRGERSEAGAGAGGDRPRGDRPARSYGPRPDGDRPPYRPRGERSEAGAGAGGDRPRGDRPARSYGPRADGDRPPYRPRGERSEAGASAGGDRPRGDRPDRPPRRDDRPFEGRGGDARPARSFGPRADGDRPPYRGGRGRSDAGPGGGDANRPPRRDRGPGNPSAARDDSGQAPRRTSYGDGPRGPRREQGGAGRGPAGGSGRGPGDRRNGPPRGAR